MKISFIFILLLFCSLHSYGTTPKIKVYCNPVLAKSTPDPTVIQAPDGMFYLYATEEVVEQEFDPYDEDQVDLSGIANAKPRETEPAA